MQAAWPFSCWRSAPQTASLCSFNVPKGSRAAISRLVGYPLFQDIMASRRGAVKQKATDKLAEAFKDTSNNAEGLAIEIESAMETMLGPSSPQFQSKLRDIVYNVKRNDGLRASVARGRVSPEELVRMDAYAMALPCEQRAAEEQQEKNISIEKTLPKQLLEVEESAGIKCSNCGSPHVAVQRKGHMDEWSGVREVQCQECGYMETRED